MQKTLVTYTAVLAVFLTAVLLYSFRQADEPYTLVPEPTIGLTDEIAQVIRPVSLDRPFDFAGEALPMDNFDVRERLDRELNVNTYWHSSTLLHIKAAARHFELIERILEEEGVPEDFKYLAVAESSLRNVTSPAGAKGFWQFMRGTAEHYGLQIDREVDERYHLSKATRAAARYIKDYKERFGSWTLAAAAYNMGGTSMSKELKLQRSDSYYDMNLSDETMRYIFRIVAIKEIIQRPHDFGFYLNEGELYEPLPPHKVIKVTSRISNWGDFAQQYGTTYRMLKIYNPWLRSHQLTNSAGKTYEILIPVQSPSSR